MLKRHHEETVDEVKFDINSISDVRERLKEKKYRLNEILREMKGLNMQIKCLESQLNTLCKHEWEKLDEETGVYNRPPKKCKMCGKIEQVAQG